MNITNRIIAAYKKFWINSWNAWYLCLKKSLFIFAKYIYLFTTNYFVAVKVIPSYIIHFCQRCLTIRGTLLICAFAVTLSSFWIVANLHSCVFFIFRNRNSRCKCGSWGMITMLLWAEKSQRNNDMWTAALWRSLNCVAINPDIFFVLVHTKAA